MNNIVKSLIFKFILTLIVAYISLGLIIRNPSSWIISYSIIATVLNYMIGDLLVLPSFGNTLASLADGAIAVIIAYIVDKNSAVFDTNSASLIALFVLVAVGEYFFHQYLLGDEEVAP